MKTIYSMQIYWQNESGIIHASEDGKYALCGQEPSGENSEYCDLSDPYYQNMVWSRWHNGVDPNVVTCKKCLKKLQKLGINPKINQEIIRPTE